MKGLHGLSSRASCVLHSHCLARRGTRGQCPFEPNPLIFSSWCPSKAPMRHSFGGTAGPASLAARDHEGTSALLNATRDMEAQRVEESLSSAVALAVVLALLFSLVATSLVTYCFHRWKLRSRRLQKAHEEYQRDHEKSGLQSSSRLVS
ncbi:hypothetical protein JRQ81_007529 [Phrynocephalus forsythii]|uniref:Uncharacterized protein n=1 Tax=Phrynocephalus forsythii TaxID=171643 RepID=A0A9Q0XE83_9SAUR|nr:hypothetical protein JRQ81_007529 [Phrynocephalus forsythii]